MSDEQARAILARSKLPITPMSIAYIKALDTKMRKATARE